MLAWRGLSPRRRSRRWRLAEDGVGHAGKRLLRALVGLPVAEPEELGGRLHAGEPRAGCVHAGRGVWPASPGEQVETLAEADDDVVHEPSLPLVAGTVRRSRLVLAPARWRTSRRPHLGAAA